MSMDIVNYLETIGAKAITLLCVLKGSFKFFANLVESLETNIRARGIIMSIKVDFVRSQSYFVSF